MSSSEGGTREEWDTPPERREQAEAQRYPEHEDPEEQRKRAGLDDDEHGGNLRDAPAPDVTR